MSLPNITDVFYLDPIANTILPPQLVLTTRSFKPLGLIKYTNWNFSLVANGMDEFTFDVYKPEDITEDMDPKKKLLLTYEKKIWDNLVDLKLILIQDYGRFEISVNYTDNTKTVKSVHARSLECELSEAKLYDFHVNDDEAMATMEVNEYNKVNFDNNGNFIPTTLCNFSDPEHSLIHRVLADKAPHWKVGNQEWKEGNTRDAAGYFTPFVSFSEDEDCELSKEFQRTYTCNGESIYEFLTGTVANEANVVFVFDTMNRVVNCYSACDCVLQHSGDVMAKAIGEDTNVFLSKEKLVNEISITSKKDNVKNTFRVEGGDDYINAMVAVANVNGTNYITQFSSLQYEDMTEELVEVLQDYIAKLKEVQPEYEALYLKLCDALDKLYELESGMMPKVSTDNDTSEGQMKIVKAKLTKMGTKLEYTASDHTGLNNNIESLAQAYVTSNYDVNVVDGSTSYNADTKKWTGDIEIVDTTMDNGEKGKTVTSTISVTTTDDEIRICEQKIEKALAKGDMISAKFFLDDCCDDDYDVNRSKVEDYFDDYSLNRLKSFYDAFENCVSILIDMGKNQDQSSIDYKFYRMYVDIRDIIGDIKKERQKRVDDAQKEVDTLNEQCASFQETYNMETYFITYYKNKNQEALGKQCYLEYCSYRREDTYSNPNYISDGLSDSECIKKAKELLEVARKEIKKACVLQRTLEIDLNNLLLLKECEQLWNKFTMFNYVRLETDDEILKLRLIGIDINGSSLSNVNVTFSDQIENIDGDIDDLASILEQAKDVNSAFPSTIRQAKQGEEAARVIGSIRQNGLIAAQTLISNADNNEVTYGGFGILCKNQGDSGDYGLKQLRIIGNGIYLTTDAWKTVEMCIGEIVYTDQNGNEYEKYGIIADTIIAGTIVGGNYGGEGTYTYWNLDTGEFHMSSSTTIEGTDENGNPIVTGINEFIVNTAEGYIKAYFQENGSIGQIQADVNELKSQYEKIESAIGSMVAGLNGYFHVRYSTSSTGSPMTDVPTIDSKYIGIHYSGSNTAPSSYSDYTWQDISSPKGYLGTLSSTNDEGVTTTLTEYLHIKFSDDGKYFTKIMNSLDFNDWTSGYYLDTKQVDETCICYPKLIKVKSGDKYQFISNDSDLMYGIAYYSDNDFSTFKSQTETKDGVLTIPSNINYMCFWMKPIPDPFYTYTYDKYKELSETGSFYPIVRDASHEDGETIGQYFGTYVDETEKDSTKFSDYTWRKFTDSEDIRLMKSYIRQNANEIELKVSEEKFNGEEIVSKINLEPGEITIDAKNINLNGTVTANDYFKILTDGSAEASGLVVENEIFTDILTVNTINNGEYQKTLINTPVLHVQATPSEGEIGEASDDNSCYWNANFMTLQGALNSIPKFMNGKTVFIRLHADVTENIVLPRISSGAIYIYLEGHAIYGYVSGSSAGEVRIYGGNRDGSALADGVEGKISAVSGTNFGGFITTVGCGMSTNMYLENLSIYGDSSTSDNRTCVCASLGGFIYVNNVKIYNTRYGFVAHAGGRMHCRYTSGIASYKGFTAAGGYISLENTTQAGGAAKNSSGKSEPNSEYSGGTIKYHTATFEGVEIGSTTTPTPTDKTETNKPTTTTKVTKTVTYSARKANSIRNYKKDNAKWRTDNAAKVGQWDSSYGYHAAFWFFEDDFTNIANKTVKKVEITFTRNSGGNSASTPHHFYAHGWESQPGSSTSPSLSSKIGSKSTTVGSTETIKIEDSTIIGYIKKKKGICAIAENEKQSNYSVLSGTMKVKFTYEDMVTS